jgi:hypothetical protein
MSLMSLGAADGGDDVSFAHRAGEMGVFASAVGDSGIADQQQHPGRFSVTGGQGRHWFFGGP